jgi:Hsp70 protein
VHSRLAIDYGAATVRAVLVTPGGTTTLRLDGTGEMSTAVHISGAGVLTGAAAWRQAGTDPDGFVASPLRAGTGQVTAGTTEVEIVDLVAATLRQVAAEAQQIAGEPVDDVRLVVPAGWGPRRRTWLRHAARTAGMPVTRLVEAPIAALTRPGSGMAAAVPGRPVLVLDVGAGCEVTVVQPGPAGSEVLSTLADPDAGGDRIDTALVHALTGAGPDELPADQRWQTLANTRAARHALSDQVAVSMPMTDGRPPMIVNTTLAAEAARPVFERVAELAAQALGNADLTVEQISGVHLIGAAAVTPGAADMITAKLGTTVRPVDLPHLAAVLGAADADTTTGPPARADPLRLPPLRRLVTLTLPGMASLGLYAHFVLSAKFNNGRPDQPRNGYYVLANWGELTVATVLATITFLQAAALFAALLDQRPTTTTTTTATIGRPSAPSRISGGIGLAIAAALATAALYAVTAAVFFNQPVTRLQEWALLPILPITAAAGAVAVLAWRRGSIPAGGWDGFLAFPVTSMITATAGILAVGLWFNGGLPWWLNGWTATIGITGGALIGAAVACTLVRHPGARVALAVPIGFFTAIISRTGPDILAVIWAIAVACWWAWHAWALIRTRPSRH